jgi:hypothetical protein
MWDPKVYPQGLTWRNRETSEAWLRKNRKMIQCAQAVPIQDQTIHRQNQ